MTVFDVYALAFTGVVVVAALLAVLAPDARSALPWVWKAFVATAILAYLSGAAALVSILLFLFATAMAVVMRFFVSALDGVEKQGFEAFMPHRHARLWITSFLLAEALALAFLVTVSMGLVPILTAQPPATETGLGGVIGQQSPHLFGVFLMLVVVALGGSYHLTQQSARPQIRSRVIPVKDTAEDHSPIIQTVRPRRF